MNKLKKILSITILLLVMSCTFTLNVFAGTSKTTATSLILGTTTTGSITTAGESQWYKFTTTGNESFYRITLLNINIDSRCEIRVYDSNDVELVSFYQSNNSSGYKDIKLPNKGTYYIKIYSYNSSKTGKFQITVKEIKDDVKDTKAQSSPLTLGTTFTGTIDAQGDIDWFNFTTTGNESFYRITLLNVNIDSRCEIRVYDSNDVELVSFYQSNNSSSYIDIKLSNKDTYYIKIYPRYSSDTGKYQVTVNEIKDDAKDTKEGASTISLNKTYNKAINANGDIDWFKFEANSTTKYRIQLKNVNIDWRCEIRVYDSNDVELVSFYQSNNSSGYEDINLPNKGTYYIKIYPRYSSNTGKYQVTIKNPATVTVNKPKITKVNSLGYNSNAIYWNKVNVATGYDVYAKSSKNGSYSKIAIVTSGTSFTHKNLSTGKTYYYKVRAYKQIGSIKHYSTYSNVVSKKAGLSIPSNFKVKKASSTSIKVSWKKVNGATGYEIYRSTSKNGTYKKITTVSGSKSSYTNKSLKKGKTYYYKIRAIQKVSKKTYKSPFSGIKNCTL